MKIFDTYLKTLKEHLDNFTKFLIESFSLIQVDPIRITNLMWKPKQQLSLRDLRRAAFSSPQAQSIQLCLRELLIEGNDDLDDQHGLWG